MRNFGPFYPNLTNHRYDVANLGILCHKYCSGVPKLANMRYVRHTNNRSFFSLSQGTNIWYLLYDPSVPISILSDCNLLMIFVIDISDNKKSQFSAIYLQVQDFIGFLLHVMYNKIKQWNFNVVSKTSGCKYTGGGDRGWIFLYTSSMYKFV